MVFRDILLTNSGVWHCKACSCWLIWLVWQKIYGKLRFYISRYGWGISWCFISLYISYILWNLIQAILGSLFDAWLLFKLDTFTNPERDFCGSFHVHLPLYLHAWLLSGNTWWMIFLWFHNHHNGTWRPWRHSVIDLQHNRSPMVRHGHPKSRLMQLPMTPCLNLGRFIDLLSLFVLSYLQSYLTLCHDIPPDSTLFWSLVRFLVWIRMYIFLRAIVKDNVGTPYSLKITV